MKCNPKRVERAGDPCEFACDVTRSRSGVALLAACVAAFALFAVACSFVVGTEAWCEKMSEKPKGDWSTNEGVDFAKDCVFD
jgi:hypothetical protein